MTRYFPLLLLAIAQAHSQTPLLQLLDEAGHNNADIRAARHAWQAAAQVPSQVSTPPDPQVTVQQFAVGSPRPFAGYSNSDFAYVGLGISQDLPYPGKLKLRGEIAQRDVASAQDRVETVRRSVLEQVKESYFRLAYIQKTLGILERDDKLLGDIAKIAEARYRVGQATQQEVLKAQLQRTKLLRELARHHQQMEVLRAQLNKLLNRPQDSPYLITEDLTETPLPYTSEELLSRIRTGNPEVSREQEMVRRQSLQLELARKDRYPDFNAQYMWQHNAEQFRDYYMLTLSARIPIYRRRKIDPEVTQAVEEQNRARREYESRVQQAYFDVRDQFLAASTASELLKIYREGLIPQSTSTYRAGLASYQAGKQDFETLLGSFLDVLNFDEEYWRTLADREIALARIEQITGVTLR